MITADDIAFSTRHEQDNRRVSVMAECRAVSRHFVAERELYESRFDAIARVKELMVRQLMQVIYGEVHDALHELRNAVRSLSGYGDIGPALAAIDKVAEAAPLFGPPSPPKYKWFAFSTSKGNQQPLPLERQYVLVRINNQHGKDGLAVGYLRFAAGIETEPYFVVPGGLLCNGEVTSWCDCLPPRFEHPATPQDVSKGKAIE